LIGGAIAGYGIISFIADIARALGAEEPTEPDMGPFIRAATVGFPVFFVGIAVAWLASLISPPRQAPSQVYTDARRWEITNPGSVVWSERDTTIHGGVHVKYTVANARQDVWNLWSATGALRLPIQGNEAAERSLAAARDELEKQNPDYSVVGKRLEEFTRILQRFNALYQAGENIVGPLTRLAKFLGPFGKGMLAVLTLL